MSRSGFTLLEALVTLGILALVSWIVVLCVSLGIDACEASRERISMQQFGQMLLQEVASGLAEADRVIVDPDGRGLAFQTREAVYHYYLESEAKQLMRTCREEDGIVRPTRVNPPDIEVGECSFTDRGDTVGIGLALRSARCVSNRRTEYRVEADVGVPNRKSGSFTWGEPDNSAPGAAPAGVRGGNSGGADNRQR